MARANRNFFKKLYRKEPISSFLVVVGLMEVVIGGADEQWRLFSLGLGLVLGAMVVRSSQLRKRQREAQKMMPRRYLPPAGVPQPLPRLVNDQSPSKNDSMFENW